MQKSAFQSEQEYQQFLQFLQFQKLQQSGKLKGVLEELDDKENQTPRSANISKKEPQIAFEEDQNLKPSFTL